MENEQGNTLEELDKIIEEKDCTSEEKDFLRKSLKYLLKGRRLYYLFGGSLYDTSKPAELRGGYGAYHRAECITIEELQESKYKLRAFEHFEWVEENDTSEIKRKDGIELNNSTILDLALRHRETIERSLKRDEEEMER